VHKWLYDTSSGKLNPEYHGRTTIVWSNHFLFLGDRDLVFNPVTLKLEADLDILKITLTLKMKLLAQGIQNLELELKKSAAVTLTLDP